jgi:hypothetical protein
MRYISESKNSGIFMYVVPINAFFISDIPRDSKKPIYNINVLQNLDFERPSTKRETEKV